MPDLCGIAHEQDNQPSNQPAAASRLDTPPLWGRRRRGTLSAVRPAFKYGEPHALSSVATGCLPCCITSISCGRRAACGTAWDHIARHSVFALHAVLLAEAVGR